MSIPGGYVFRPSRYSPPIGHAGLDIELTDSGRHRGGCICSATFPVIASRPTERTFIDTHREDGVAGSLHVCAGGFRLRAGNDDMIHGFSFGGTVSVSEEGDHAICRLESPAPVFDLAYEVSSTSVFLYSEFVALLARRRAVWADDVAFGRRLDAVEPFSLFIAVLAALVEYLGSFRGTYGMEEYRRGAAAVRRSIGTLRAVGEWPLVPPLPAELI